MSRDRRVVVTGLSAVSPAGVGAEALWRAARDGQSFGARVSGFDVSANRSQIAAEVPALDWLALGLDREDLARLDRVDHFSLVAARGALLDAGLERFEPHRAGVVIGTAVGGVGFMEQEFRRVCRRQDKDKPSWVAVDPVSVNGHLYSAFLAHSVSSEVARRVGFEGPCFTVATGCTAGLDALGAAAELIACGLADVMITGGADAPVTPIVLTAFDNINCLTRRNDDPGRASRPFDRDRDGFLLAEGCGVLVLEEEEHARRRGARTYGSVLGFASLSNAFHMTSLPAEGTELARTLDRLFERSRVSPDQVDYINAHGSSTKQNDRNETAAFKLTFGARAKRIPISSTKSVLGHSLGAASALESVVCFRALAEGMVPPTANYENPSADCDLDYVPNQPREARLRVIECNASGFSGIHSAALFGHPDFRPGKRRGFLANASGTPSPRSSEAA